MSDIADILGLSIPLAGIALGGVSVFLSHVRKLAEIKARAGMLTGTESVGAGVQAELQALRGEVAKLRDTSTKFDLSFDAGLSRLEERVARVGGNAVCGARGDQRSGRVAGRGGAALNRIGRSDSGGRTDTVQAKRRVGERGFGTPFDKTGNRDKGGGQSETDVGIAVAFAPRFAVRYQKRWGG